MAKGKCFSVNCLKHTLDTVNFILLFTGIILLGISISILHGQSEIIILLSTSTYSIIIDFLLIAAGLLLFVSIVGCFAVKNANRKVLLIYIFVLLFIILTELMVVLVSYIYDGSIDDEFQSNLNQTMVQNYGIDDDKTEAIDNLQQKFSCCGAANFQDWSFSTWKLTNLTNNLAPDSCCRSFSPKCGIRDHPSNIYYDGCFPSIKNDISTRLLVIILTGLGVCVFQLIGLLLAIKLYLNLKEQLNISEVRTFLHNT